MGESEANEMEIKIKRMKAKTMSKAKPIDKLAPSNISNGFVSDSRKKQKADVFTVLAEDMLYKARGPKENPQKTADRTCLRKFAMKVLETHDPQEAGKSLQQALSELERLANDHKVNNPMAVFITRNRS